MAISLQTVRKGKNILPPRIFLYATHGIGKSTFASEAQNPIFLCTEDGLDAIDTHAQKVTSTNEILEMCRALYADEHEYKTVVIDSVDWAENIFMREIEAKYSEKELAYGKSAIYLQDNWSKILAALDFLRQKGMTIILIGHCEIKRFDNPETDSYDRYQPKLQARSSSMLQEWADCVLFANNKTVIKEEEVGFNNTRKRGLSNFGRVIYTQESAAYLAKNRYGLPPEIKMSKGTAWSSFMTAFTEATK
jgi:hypothetical protein